MAHNYPEFSSPFAHHATVISQCVQKMFPPPHIPRIMYHSRYCNPEGERVTVGGIQIETEMFYKCLWQICL